MPPSLLGPEPRKAYCTGRRLRPHFPSVDQHSAAKVLGWSTKRAGDVDPVGTKGLPARDGQRWGQGHATRLVQGSGVQSLRPPEGWRPDSGKNFPGPQELGPHRASWGAAPAPTPPPGFPAGVGGSEAGGGGCRGEDESFMSDLRPPLLVPCCLMFQFGRKQNIQSGGLSA